MKAFASFFARAALIAGLAGFFAPAALAAPGQDFPGVTCTCKGCASGGGDLTGDCASVCKDKTVYSKGSEPHDYCKASATMTGNELFGGLTLAGITVEQLANFSQVDPSTIKEMIARGSQPVRAEGETCARSFRPWRSTAAWRLLRIVFAWRGSRARAVTDRRKPPPPRTGPGLLISLRCALPTRADPREPVRAGKVELCQVREDDKADVKERHA